MGRGFKPPEPPSPPPPLPTPLYTHLVEHSLATSCSYFCAQEMNSLWVIYSKGRLTYANQEGGANNVTVSSLCYAGVISLVSSCCSCFGFDLLFFLLLCCCCYIAAYCSCQHISATRRGGVSFAATPSLRWLSVYIDRWHTRATLAATLYQLPKHNAVYLIRGRFNQWCQ